MKHDTYSLGPPCYEPGGCVQHCRACQYEKLQADNASLRAAIRLHQTVEKAADEELAKLKLQKRELSEAKGNLLDFIGCVRTWAIGQPTAKSIQESCLGILEKYAVKRIGAPLTAQQIWTPLVDHPFGCRCQDDRKDICHVVKISGQHCNQPMPCPSH